MKDIRAQLRDGTAPAHAALERALAIEARLDDQREIVLILARFRGFFAALEAALDRVLGPRIMSGRHRLADIEVDLAALGLHAHEVARLPICDPAGLLPDPDFGLGALYVTEGARLGGRVIARAASVTSWYPEHGLRFWSDRDGSGYWRSLLAELEASPRPESVLAGANATFSRLHDWLEGGGVLA